MAERKARRRTVITDPALHVANWAYEIPPHFWEAVDITRTQRVVKASDGTKAMTLVWTTAIDPVGAFDVGDFIYRKDKTAALQVWAASGDALEVHELHLSASADARRVNGYLLSQHDLLAVLRHGSIPDGRRITPGQSATELGRSLLMQGTSPNAPPTQSE